jgi:hypothetical protein
MAIAEEGEEEVSQDRRSGVTLRKGTAVTVSVALLLQLAYVVFTGGRVVEKVDTMAADVLEIKRNQYTAKDAERDNGPIRRDVDRIDRRVGDLEVRVRAPGR